MGKNKVISEVKRVTAFFVLQEKSEVNLNLLQKIIAEAVARFRPPGEKMSGKKFYEWIVAYNFFTRNYFLTMSEQITRENLLRKMEELIQF